MISVKAFGLLFWGFSVSTSAIESFTNQVSYQMNIYYAVIIPGAYGSVILLGAALGVKNFRVDLLPSYDPDS
jgi:hypothetical protein